MSTDLEPRPRTPEEVLDRAESRARERIFRDADDLKSWLGRSLEEGGLIRRHPYIAIAGAASLGVLLGPALLRALRSPGAILRGAGRFLVQRPPGRGS